MKQSKKKTVKPKKERKTWQIRPVTKPHREKGYKRKKIKKELEEEIEEE